MSELIPFVVKLKESGAERVFFAPNEDGYVIDGEIKRPLAGGPMASATILGAVSELLSQDDLSSLSAGRPRIVRFEHEGEHYIFEVVRHPQGVALGIRSAATAARSMPMRDAPRRDDGAPRRAETDAVAPRRPSKRAPPLNHDADRSAEGGEPPPVPHARRPSKAPSDRFETKQLRRSVNDGESKADRSPSIEELTKVANDAARETAQQAARETAQQVAREMGQQVARETAQQAARETAQQVAREAAQHLAKQVEAVQKSTREGVQQVAQQVAREAAQQVAREAAQHVAKQVEIAQKATRDGVQQAAQQVAREAAQQVAREAAQHVAKQVEAAQLAMRDAVNEITRKIAQEVALHATREAAEHISRTAQKVAREAGREAARDVARDTIRDALLDGQTSDADVAPSGVSLQRGSPKIDVLLREMLQKKASDLHLSADSVPVFRVDGEIKFASERGALGSADILGMVQEIMTPRARKDFDSSHDADFAHEIAGLARFRVNVFKDRHGTGAVLRQIPIEVLTAETLGLPKACLDMCWLSKGLVLVTGPTGSGKSTTLAAMIDFINKNRSDHIITIEDPVEFVHQNQKCLVNQREVGQHTAGFKNALRAALREDPDIVLVGEMRDLETISIAIETAETGHLVFGTLHTTTAISTVDRIIDQFPSDRQDQIRVMLSESLKGVVAQVLCPKIGGGRVAAQEILLGNHAVASMIREGKTFQLSSVMQTSKGQGMITMNDALLTLVQKKLVDPKQAYLKAVDKTGFVTLLKNAGIPAPV